MRAALKSIERFDKAAPKRRRPPPLRIVQGIERNEPRILIGSDARFMDLLQRFRPATYWSLACQADREDGKHE